MALEIQSVRQTIAVAVTTAADGLSTGYDLQGYRVCSIDMSTAWTTADMTFQAANTSGGTFQDVFTSTGGELTITTTGAHNVALNTDVSRQLSAHRFLKLRSGTSTAAVAQDAARTLTLVVNPN